MRKRARADFLFGSKGVAMRGGGLLPRGVRIVLVDRSGYWVNKQGKRTDRRANGTWTRGNPVWRDGGWRNRKGAPTYRRPNGTWSNGKGVKLRAYRDRFRLARDDERVPWQAVAAPASLAPRGARIAVDGLVSSGCLFVDRVLRHAAHTIEILVPHGSAIAGSAGPVERDRASIRHALRPVTVGFPRCASSSCSTTTTPASTRSRRRCAPPAPTSRSGSPTRRPRPSIRSRRTTA